MRFLRQTLRSPLFGVMCGVAAAAALPAAAAEKITPIEVLQDAGDDLSKKLKTALELAFTNAADHFITGLNERDDALLVIVTKAPAKAGSDLTYPISFTSKGNDPLGTMDVTCAETKLAECAAKVVEQAKTIAANMTH